MLQAYHNQERKGLLQGQELLKTIKIQIALVAGLRIVLA